MRKIIYLIGFLAILVKPSYPAEHIGVLNDGFFARGDTVVTMRAIIPHENGYRALLDASSEHRSETTSVSPFIAQTYVNDDVSRTSRLKINATVVCGAKYITGELLRDQLIPYVLVREFENNPDEPRLGVPVFIYHYQEYRRPDNTLFNVRGAQIYTLELLEETLNTGTVSVCEKEWNIISQWKQKLRHQRRLYHSSEIYRILRRKPMNAGAPWEEISRNSVRKELRYWQVEAEVPECGTLGRSIPGQFKVVG